MKNNKFIQCSLFQKQKKHHQSRQTHYHLMVFCAFVILFRINQVGCADKTSGKEMLKDEETYLREQETNSEEDMNYDPWRDSERPKLFVDYLNGPLKGRCRETNV